MCNDFNTLVELSDWRYIAQCEHKTVHLRWDHLTISLPPHAFLQLARQILAESTPENALSPQQKQMTTANAQPRLRLRLNTVLLEFADTDLVTLRSLLQQTLELPAQDKPMAAVPMHAHPNPAAPLVPPRHAVQP